MRFVVHHTALLHLAASDARVPEAHQLLAPSSSRSHVLSTLHQAVQRGELDEKVASQQLSYVRGLRLRLLGDAVMQRVAWEVADRLGWPTTYDAEYIALTILQADALVVMDGQLATAAREIVTVAPVESLLG